MTIRWKQHIREAYNLEESDYNVKLKLQGGRCAICGTDSPEYGIKTKFEIDHCHQTGRIRGLLCGKCNRGLGMSKDSIEILLRGAKYLESAIGEDKECQE